MLAAKTEEKMQRGFWAAANQRLCPDCRAVMDEVDRLTENGILFVWYECTRDNCGGQWLEKRIS